MPAPRPASPAHTLYRAETPVSSPGSFAHPGLPRDEDSLAGALPGLDAAGVQLGEFHRAAHELRWGRGGGETRTRGAGGGARAGGPRGDGRHKPIPHAMHGGNGARQLGVLAQRDGAGGSDRC